MVKAVGFEEHIFSGKAQVGSLHKIVLIAGVFQDVAQADILREEARHRGRGVAFKGGKQRDAALGGDHPGDGVIGAGELHGVAEVETFVFQGAQIRRQVREGIVIEIGSLQALAVDIHQIKLRVSDRFRWLFIVRHEIRIAVARLGFHQLGDLVKRRAGIHGGQRKEKRQQAVAMVVRKMTAAAQDPGERTKNHHQSHHQPQTGENVFTHARARQAIGQRVEHCIVDTVAGKVVAGVERNV